MTKTNPKISIVACSRNDDHGKDLLNRCSLFVKGLIKHSNNYKLNIELIIVEWNPPADKPLLKEVLPLPHPDDFLSLRFIIVPSKIHQSIPSKADLPLHQMIAKNVGIRRAKAPFVLCTNNDLLFSNELFKYFNKNNLKENVFYRAIRCDVPQEVNYNLTVDDQLIFFKNNIINRKGKHHHFPEVIEIDSLVNKFPPASWLLCRLSRIRQRFLPAPKDIFISLDTEACGDFTLMSKRDWLDIGGYFENGAYPAHVDMLALISARLKGKKQIILPPECCSFHITHEDGWDLEDPVRNLYKDIARPRLDWRTVKHLAAHFVKHKKTLSLNPPNWGFQDIDFEEHQFGANFG